MYKYANLSPSLSTFPQSILSDTLGELPGLCGDWDAEHLFMCLLYIYMSLKKCLVTSFVHFPSELSLYYWVVRVQGTDFKSLLIYNFSHFVVVPFFWWSFQTLTFPILIRPNLPVFFLLWAADITYNKTFPNLRPTSTLVFSPWGSMSLATWTYDSS